jgi:copper chaperone CopZ
MKKQLLTLTTTIGLLASQSQAADATFCYQGEVAGVVCNACAGNVKEALLKLDGVKDVKITLNKDGGNPRLTILSNSPALTREAAVKALGKSAGHYDIRSLEKTPSR